MAQIEFKCPQCGQLVAADDSLRGQAVECPSCEKGIVVPRIQLNVGRPKSVVKLHPAVQNDTNDSSPRDPNVTRRISEFERMADREAEQKRHQQRHELLMLLLKTVAVVLVVAIGLSKWKDLKNIENLSRVEEVERKLGIEKEKARQISDMAQQKVLESENKVRDAEKKIMEMERKVHEYEQRVSDAERTIKDMHDRLNAINAEHERKMDVVRMNHQREVAELNMDHQRDLERISKARDAHRQIPMTTAESKNQDEENPPNASSEDLRSQLNKNLSEIKRLRNENPSCYLNPDTTKIVSISRKLAPIRERKYSVRNQIALVRDTFYCTGCKETSTLAETRPCCDVSKIQSFFAWRKARLDVDITAKINSQIDELYNENASLEKRMRATQK